MSDITDQPLAEPAVPRPPVGRARRFKTPRTIAALILREMQTTYGRSAGGYLWALLEPIGGIALFTFILSTGFRIRTPSIGENFPLFLATGLLILTLFLAISGRVSGVLASNKALLFYPGVKYTDAIIAGFLLTLLTQILVFYVVIVGIHYFYGLSSIIDFYAVFGAVAMTAFLGLGFGVLNCFLFNAYPVWGNIWRVMTRPLFLVSCILFTFEDIPKQFQDIAWWNPISHGVGLMRRGFYTSYDATYVSPIFVCLLGAITLFFGLVFLNRFHRDFLNR